MNKIRVAERKETQRKTDKMVVGWNTTRPKEIGRKGIIV